MSEEKPDLDSYDRLKAWVRDSFNSVAGPFLEAVAEAGHSIVTTVDPTGGAARNLRSREHVLEDAENRDNGVKRNDGPGF